MEYSKVPPEDFEWFRRLVEAAGEKLVRVPPGGALLLPAAEIWKIINSSEAEMWQIIRSEKPFLPVWKTMEKNNVLTGPTPTEASLRKIYRGCGHRRLFQMRLEQWMASETMWRPAIEWTGLIDSGLFQNDPAKAFWLNVIDEAAELHGTHFFQKSPAEKIEIYKKSSLVQRLGSPLARQSLKPYCYDVDREPGQELDVLLVHCLLVDTMCVLVRLAAWMTADFAVSNWAMVVRDNTENIIPFESMLPAYDHASAKWNRPFEACLKSYSQRAGACPDITTATFLGKLWSRSVGSDDPTSKIRLARNWIQEKPGRPKHSSLEEVAKALVDEQLRRHPGMAALDESASYFSQVLVLRLIETMGFVRRDLTRHGVSDELVVSVFQCFGEEYRIAREMLGKPIEE